MVLQQQKLFICDYNYKFRAVLILEKNGFAAYLDDEHKTNCKCNTSEGEFFDDKIIKT